MSNMVADALSHPASGTVPLVSRQAVLHVPPAFPLQEQTGQYVTAGPQTSKTSRPPA